MMSTTRSGTWELTNSETWELKGHPSTATGSTCKTWRLDHTWGRSREVTGTRASQVHFTTVPGGLVKATPTNNKSSPQILGSIR
jgi:hypothetical protein